MMENLKGVALDFPHEPIVIAGVSNLEIEFYDGWQNIEKYKFDF